MIGIRKALQVSHRCAKCSYLGNELTCDALPVAKRDAEIEQLAAGSRTPSSRVGAVGGIRWKRDSEEWDSDRGCDVVDIRLSPN